MNTFEKAKVCEIIFNRIGDEEIIKIADCEITREPKQIYENTIYDSSLGCYDRAKFCFTCVNNWQNCIGGFGRIELPVLFAFYNNFKEITLILQKICYNCSSYLYDENVKIDSRKIFKQCSKCDGGNLFLIENKKDNNQISFISKKDGKIFTLNDIRNIFSKISPQTISKINPKINLNTYICKQFLVPPIDVRPFLQKNSFSQPLHNDLSSMYLYLQKTCLKKKIIPKDITDIITMILTQKNNQSLPNSCQVPQSILQWLQGKNGIINSNINGKRVNHSSRATITGYPNGSLGYVGIPECMAEKMMVEVLANTISKQMLRRTVEEMSQKNTNFSIKLKQSTKIFRITKNSLENVLKIIRPTDTIERKIADGDVILFNRQPSLRPESIIAMKVKIIKNCNTFRLCLPCTPPLNADFDGDECNIHILQDMCARIECEELMNVGEQIISSQRGAPIITPVQDAIVGSYLMTKINVDVKNWTDYVMNVYRDGDDEREGIFEKIKRLKYFNRKELKSREIFSLIFDKKFHFKKKNISIIKNSMFLSDDIVITKPLLCSRGGIIHEYYIQIGKRACCRLIDDIQRITNCFLLNYGFTVGLVDCAFSFSNQIIRNFSKSNSKNDENFVNSFLGSMELMFIQNEEKIKDNNFYTMIKSGSKGSFINLIQISSAIGQQSIDGTRVKREMKTNRCMPTFRENDESIESFGFICSSFFKGMSPTEMIIHCKTGRRGVSDSVTKVSESGYLHKKLTKRLENIVIEYDLTVRFNDTKQIIQFKFGDDGACPQRMPLASRTNRHILIKKSDNINENLFEKNLNNIINRQCGNVIPKCFTENLIKNIIFLFNQDDADYDETNFTNDNENEKLKIERIIHERSYQPMTPIGLITATNFGEISSQLLLKSFHHSGVKTKDISGGIKQLIKILSRTKSCGEFILSVFINDPLYDIYRQMYLLCKTDEARDIMFLLMDLRIRIMLKPYRQIFLFQLFSTTASSVYFKKHSITYELCKKKIEYFLIENIQTEIILNIQKELNEKFNGSKNLVLIQNKNDIIKIKIKFYDGNILLYHRFICNINICSGFIDACDIEYCKIEKKHELHFKIPTNSIFNHQKIQSIFELSFIDVTKIEISDVFIFMHYFGIEAARKWLYNEILKILQFDGADIERRYLSLIVDTMCVDGRIKSISTIGGVLTNAMFEKEVKKINTYAQQGARDDCTSVESAVFLGRVVRFGTGGFDVIVDDENNDEKKIFENNWDSILKIK